MKIGKYELNKQTLLGVLSWIKKESDVKYWKRNAIYFFFLMDVILSIGTYVIYINIAVDLKRIEPAIFAYCGTSELIACIGLAFLFGKKHRYVGEFIVLVSIPWLMFFGIIADWILLVYNNYTITFSTFPSFIRHGFMTVQAFILLRIVKTEDVVFPLALGAAGLCLFMLSSRDFWNIIVFISRGVWVY